MSNIRYWRVFKLTGISLAAIFIVAISFIFANGAKAQNNPPIISSEPTLVVTTDQTYSYTINSTDIDNDELSYALTTAPDGMTLNGNMISWSPITAGLHNVVIQVADTNNGFNSQSWQVDVKAGDVRSIVVTPNDRPTIMEQDKTAQFTAKAYDNFGNLIEGAVFSWTADSEFTTVDSNGLVTAVELGTGYVKANIGDIQSAPGIIVQKAPPTDEVVETTTDEETTTTDDSEETNTTEELSSNLDDVELLTSVDDEEADDSDNEEEACEENVNHSLTFILLIIYVAILAIYFMYEKKHKSSSWWIFPLLITFIGLIIYYRYFCPQTYLWWPWVMVIIGVIITGYYKGRTEKEDDVEKNELPF